MTARERLKNYDPEKQVSAGATIPVDNRSARERLLNVKTDGKINVATPKQEEPAEDRGFWERASDALSGYKNRAAASYAGAGSAVMDALGEFNTRIRNYQNAGAEQTALENIARYEAMLAETTDPAEREKIQGYIQSNQNRLKAMQGVIEAERKPAAEVAEAAGDVSQRYHEAAQEDIARAKEGASTAGQIAVDVGGVATDVLTDAILNRVAPGLGTANRVTRTFGATTQEAKRSGADLGEQLIYGAGAAALGEGVNRLFGGNTILRTASGGGKYLDDLIGGLGKSGAGKIAGSAVGEAFEEGLENVADTVLRRVVYDEDAVKNFQIRDALYDALIGGIVGGTTGTIDVGMDAVRGRQNPAGNSAGTPSVSAEGSFTPSQKTTGESKKTAPEVGAEQITTQENIARYRSDIDDVFSGKHPSGKVIRMGDTPSILLKYGAQPRPLTMTQDAAYKVAYPAGYMGGKHNLGMSVVKQLPYQLADPVAILKSASQDNSLVILTEWKDGETDVIVPVHLDKQGAIDLENRAASAYGKGDIDRILGENNANVLYTKNNEDIRQLLSKGVQFPQAMADDILAKNSLPQPDPNVNVDPLLQLMMGGKRVDQSRASNEQFAALAERGDVGMDAAGKMFRVDPVQHIDRRSMEGVGDRKVNAFQFDHPQLHPYYQKAANALIADADISLQFPVVRSYERTVQGNRVNQRVQASEHLRMAMKETGLSRREIMDAAQRIIHDKGQENVKAAKQVEIILDYMLTNGWTTMAGESVEPNARYIAEKNAIAGSLPQVDDAGLDGIGAADAGSVNSAYDNLQARSEHFHPEGANVAEGRHVDVPTTDFAGRNIPRSASNLMGAQGTPDAAVVQMEQEIASGKLSFDTITDTDAVSRAQATMKEKGFEGALEQYRQAVGNNTATKDNTCLGQQLLLTAMRNGNTAATAELLALYTRNSTTAAQAMQAQSIFRKLSPEGQLVAMQKAVDALNEKYGTKAKLDEADVADFMNAKTTEARKQVEERMVKKAAKAIPGTFKARFDAIRYLAMLGNPRTHIRNILGNTLFQVPVAAKNRLGAAAEMAANALSGAKVERTKSLFGVNPMGRLAAEARADWVNARDFLTQTSKYSDGSTHLRDIEREAHAFSDGNVVGRTINAAADLNSRALEAEDTAAKRWIYTQSLAGYLKANGCKSLAEADPALLNRARNYAAQEALRGTFNDRNAVSEAVNTLGKVSNSSNPAMKAAGYVVEGVLPFKRTPANIAVRAVEYSPVGAFLGAFDTLRGAWNGDMARVSTGLDRAAAGLTGSALLYAGFLAAGAGYVTGGEDEDENQSAFDDLTGHQAYALELQDGTSITLDWLAPEAIPFFMGVELYEQGLAGGVELKDIWSAVKNASAPMLEMSMLQGLNDTFENAAYAKNRGESVMGTLVTSALTNYATQVFPTIGGQIERSTEDVRMTTYTDKNGRLPTDLQYTLGKVSQKVPGWEYQQIPYIDAWGRTEATGDPLQRSVNNLFNPAYISQVEVDKVEGELQRLADATGRTTIFPDRAERQITVGGEDKDLTAEQYVKYATAKGQNSYSLVRSAMESDAYRRMGDGEKAEFLAAMYGYAGYKAKRQMFPAYTDTAYIKYAEAEAKGISPVEFYTYKDATGDLTADKDTSGKSISGSKKEKVVAAIDAMDLTPMEKDWLYLLNGYTAKDMADLPWKR